MKTIQIIGATQSGKTTIGQILAEHLPNAVFDIPHSHDQNKYSTVILDECRLGMADKRISKLPSSTEYLIILKEPEGVRLSGEQATEEYVKSQRIRQVKEIEQDIKSRENKIADDKENLENIKKKFSI